MMAVAARASIAQSSSSMVVLKTQRYFSSKKDEEHEQERMLANVQTHPVFIEEYIGKFGGKLRRLKMISFFTCVMSLFGVPWYLAGGGQI